MDLYGTVTATILPPVVIIAMLLWQPNSMLRSLWIQLTFNIFAFVGLGIAIVNWGDPEAITNGWLGALPWLVRWNLLWALLVFGLSLRQHFRTLRPTRPRPAPPLTPRIAMPSHVQAAVAVPDLLRESVDITITGMIDVYCYERFRTQCKNAVQTPTRDVVITLDCEGGSSHYAYEIRSLVERLIEDGKHVTIIAREICASASTTILTSVWLQNRFASDGTVFIIHNGIDSKSGLQVPLSDPWSVRQRQDLVDRTGIDPDSLTRLYEAGGDYTFGTDEAIRLGLIAAVI